MSERPIDPQEARLGLAAAGGAYVIWGVLPIYLKILGFASAWEILGQRILWSIPAAAGAMLIVGGWRQTRAALAKPGVLWSLCLSATVIAVNWAVFVWAVANARVIEASLAYFMSPLVNVAIGVSFFGERLHGRQALAVGVGALGVALQGVALGHVPWVALALAGTWAIYSVVRREAPIPAAGGLLTEAALLAPIAAGGLIFLSLTGPTAFDDSLSNAVLLAVSGPLTAAPLILFALGARRISFIALGMLQYLAPTLQLLIGVAFGEPFGGLRAASFALIWVGLALFTWERIRSERRA
jgi:chloramphenicol-sensitive protein RarD